MEKLYILWTNADEVAFNQMVAMYARNAKLNGWWDDITVIIWGPTAQLAAESELVASKIRELIQAGIKFSACKACSDSLGTTERLIEMGVEVKYWGEGLTEVLKSGVKLITV
jgi:hypothetical protein